MKEDQESLFISKKSLLRRSRVTSNSIESDEKRVGLGVENAPKDSKTDQVLNGQSGDSTRSTWRSADSNSSSIPRICKQCGKAFKSLKALCGHMASHSEKDKNPKPDDEDDDDDDCWSSDDSEKPVLFDSHSDTETEDLVIKTTPNSCKKKLLRKVNDHGSSSLTEIDIDERDEIAMCLMRLSRDRSEYSGNKSVALENNHPIRKNADSEIKSRSDEKGNNMISDDTESSDSSGYFLDGCGGNDGESEVVSVDRSRRQSSFNGSSTKDESSNRSKLVNHHQAYHSAAIASYFAGIDSRKRKPATRNENHHQETEACDDNPQKKSKYECFNCKKTFKSYQALGGHRPCHKRMNVNYEPRFENVPEDSKDNRFEASPSSKGKAVLSEKKEKGKKNKAHACPYCDRVFKNGQALGGHKRSHFLGGNNEGINNSSHVKEIEAARLFDLNLPAPKEEGEEQEDDDDDDGDDDDVNEEVEKEANNGRSFTWR